MDANDNAIYDAMEQEDDLDMNLDVLEDELEAEIDGDLTDLAGIIEDREHIGNPDALGETVMNVVWEQFMNQVAVIAGEDFIKENGGMKLDLRDETHIQTSENFAKGKLATHNHIRKEQLEQNYKRFTNTPHKEFRDKYVDPGMNATLKRAGELKKKGIDTVKDIYTGRQIPTETKLPSGEKNPKAAQREHVTSSAELYSNPTLQMGLNNKELAAVINNPENLQGYTTAERNIRKSDSTTAEMSEKDRTKHYEAAKEKSENYRKQVEQKISEHLKQEGRQTQKEEFFRISGKALRSALMMILASLVKELFGKLVLWLKSAEKNIHTLVEYVKAAIISFVGKFKELLVNVSSSVLTTIATAIIGPVVGIIRKTITLLNQGRKSLKEAVQYLRDPANKGRSLHYLIPEVGKIVVAGLSGIGAIVLGEFIEDVLMAFPFMAVSIPILGTPANLVGLLLGAIVCGVIGAIALNLIDKFIAKKQAADNQTAQIDQKNEILEKQETLTMVKAEQLRKTKVDVGRGIIERHIEAEDEIQRIRDKILRSGEDADTKGKSKKISDDLDELLQF